MLYMGHAVDFKLQITARHFYLWASVGHQDNFARALEQLVRSRWSGKLLLVDWLVKR